MRPAENSAPHIDLYCESAPLKENLLGYGLSRALIPIINGLDHQIKEIHIFPRDGFTRKRDLLPVAREKIMLASNILAKLTARTESKNPFITNILFKISLWLTRRSRKKELDTKYVLAVIGANYQSLIRASAFARHRSAKLVCYFVDEIDNPAASSSNTALDSRKLISLKSSDISGFSITNELSKLLFEKYQFKTEPLPLPYIISEKENGIIKGNTLLKNQAIYIGSINFLYKSSLLLVIEELRKINQDKDQIELRLTVTKSTAERQLGELPVWVKCEPIPSRAEMLAEIAASRIAIMPSSFEKTAKSMVSTSFPSKFLDYLAAARDIFVLAPPYASITRYLMDIPEIISHTRIDGLIDLLKYSSEQAPGRFQYLIAERHSTAHFGDEVAALIRTMNEDVK